MNTNSRKSIEATPAIPWNAIYHLLLRRAWLISACVVVALFAGFGYLSHTPKVYAARTVVQVEENETKIINIQSVTSDDANTADLVKTIEQNFMSNDLLLRVAKTKGLGDNPHFLPKGKSLPASDEDLLKEATSAVSVKLRRGTRLLDIVAEHTDPTIAQLLAQTLVREYLRSGFEQKVSMSQMANQFLLEEANRLKTNVEKSEHALQEYREKNDAASLEDKQNITVEKLKELNSNYTAAQGTRMKLEAEYAQANSLANSSMEDLLTIPSVAANLSVTNAKAAVDAKNVEISTLSKRYGPEHPKWIQAQSQLRGLNDELDRTVRKTAASLKVEYDAAVTTESKFKEALAHQQKEALDLNRTAIPYNSLTRDVQSDQAMYDAVLKRLKETEVAKGVDASNIRLVENARVPLYPISPVPARIIALSLLVGLTLGFGLVLLLYVTDSSIRTVDEAENQLGLPAFSAVPFDSKLKEVTDWSVLVHEPESQIAEAFRSLRTSLSIKNGDGARLILFTSAAPAEGKSFCSANAAVAFAQLGLTTLLIDADLRRPQQAKMFATDTRAAGLTEHLETGLSLNELIKPTDQPGLFLLSAGKVARNPAELLNKQKLESLFSNPSLAAFDRIIIDSAPVNAVSDTLNLVKFVDSICLVVRASKTPKRAIARAFHGLEDAGAQNVGLVLNRMPRSSGTGYYYYYSAGSYGSKGVYGAGEAKVNA